MGCGCGGSNITPPPVNSQAQAHLNSVQGSDYWTGPVQKVAAAEPAKAGAAKE